MVIQSTHVHLHSNFGASQLKVRFGSWPIGANDIASATLRICAHRSDQNVYCLKFMSKLKSLRSLRSFSRFPVAGPTDPVEICGLKLVCRGGLKLDPRVLQPLTVVLAMSRLRRKSLRRDAYLRSNSFRDASPRSLRSWISWWRLSLLAREQPDPARSV